MQIEIFSDQVCPLLQGGPRLKNSPTNKQQGGQRLCTQRSKSLALPVVQNLSFLQKSRSFINPKAFRSLANVSPVVQRPNKVVAVAAAEEADTVAAEAVVAMAVPNVSFLMPFVQAVGSKPRFPSSRPEPSRYTAASAIKAAPIRF
jgi:hypothetical protein